MTFCVLPEATGESIAAALWYEDRVPGLGEAFHDEVQRAYAAIQSLPDSFTPLDRYSGRHRVRRAFLQRFPYAVVFLRQEDALLVVAVAHTHRRPLYWLDRLH